MPRLDREVPDRLGPGRVVFARPIGLFKMEDEHGIDNHLLCVPCLDPGWNHLRRLGDPPDQLRTTHFFASYKDLDPTGTRL